MKIIAVYGSGPQFRHDYIQDKMEEKDVHLSLNKFKTQTELLATISNLKDCGQLFIDAEHRPKYWFPGEKLLFKIDEEMFATCLIITHNEIEKIIKEIDPNDDKPIDEVQEKTYQRVLDLWKQGKICNEYLY